MKTTHTIIPGAIVLATSVLAQDVVTEAQRPVEKLRAEAATLRPLVSSDLVRGFLAATDDLPAITADRIVYWDGVNRRAMTPQQVEALTTERADSGIKKMTLGEQFYYYTAYGSPLAYSRALDLAAGAGFTTASGTRVCDFGFGGIGHLRLLASLGAEAVGIEILELLREFYREPGDTGVILRSYTAGPGPNGSVTLLFGSFPGQSGIVEQVGGGYDLFISKNVLKKGYVHPERPADPSRLVNLGVDDETFVRAVYDTMKPGGLFVIYNLYPPQNPPDEPYMPHASGECPFDKSLVEKTGFEIVAFDIDDTAAARAMGAALGWHDSMNLDADLFAMYTILRRPPA